MLEMIFLTSNRVKFEHLTYLSTGTGVRLLEPPEYGRPYYEPRIDDRDSLLRQSMESANFKLLKRLHNRDDDTQENFSWLPEQHSKTAKEHANIFQDKFFIIEDTSVKIEALSEKSEYPGVDVKYWMKKTTFEELDAALIAKGNNRNVTVRSDIALYIPPKFRRDKDQTYIVFTGISKGRITEQEIDLETNPLYPWLDNQTFNKWFIPDGEEDILSRLPINLAYAYDFRASAFSELVNYFRHRKLILDSPQKTSKHQQQLQLFGEKNFVIAGPTCAGKTTVAEHLSEQHGYYHIEASDFMHCLFHRRAGGDKADESIHTFAPEILKAEPQVVALEIYSHIQKFGLERYVISGFRSPKEIDIFLDEIDSGAVQLIYIDAPQAIRFQRNINRARPDLLDTLDKFKERDALQKDIGLDSIRANINTSIFRNVFDTANFFKQEFEQKFCPPLLPSMTLIEKPNLEGPFSLEESILLALFTTYRDQPYYTTTEISKLINANIRRVSSGKIRTTNKNNVSRYFNMTFYPFYRLKIDQGKRKYKLSVTGHNRAKSIIRKLGSAIKIKPSSADKHINSSQ